MNADKRLWIIKRIRNTLQKCVESKLFQIDEDKLLEEIMRVERVPLKAAQSCLKMAKGGGIDVKQRRLGRIKRKVRSSS